jgi:hypothetical protein
MRRTITLPVACFAEISANIPGATAFQMHGCRRNAPALLEKHELRFASRAASPLLMRQQPCLDGHGRPAGSPTVASGAARGRHHPMAGDHDDPRITGAGTPHRTRTGTEFMRQFAVAAPFAAGDSSESGPHPALKGRTFQRQGKIEAEGRIFEVAIELERHLGGQTAGAAKRDGLGKELQRLQTAIPATNAKTAHGTRDHGIMVHGGTH